MTHTFTSESVTEGHPDKIADQISDAVLDNLLEQDPKSKVACETLLANGLCVVAGEITTEGYADVLKIARDTLQNVGYDSSESGIDGSKFGVISLIGSQSPAIADGVKKSYEVRIGQDKDDYDKQGAGDQGMMFGYACRETEALMPLPIFLAHRLAEQLAEVRRREQIPYLRPDGKTQVTIKYDGTKPIGIDNIVVSTQHKPHVGEDSELEQTMRPDIIKFVIDPVVGKFFGDVSWVEELGAEPKDESEYKVLVNPSGKFDTGGPEADAGLTGRKIIVDTYGGYARHGGGAFSGKDPSKVDRSAAYAARWVAKHIVEAGISERCEVRIAYAIGKANPVDVGIETFGTESDKVDLARLQEVVKNESQGSGCFDLRPKKIIETLGLLKPIYSPTATYGHFGRESEGGRFLWEKIDSKIIKHLKSELKL